MKKIISEHSLGTGTQKVYREEVEFNNSATEEEIGEELEAWVWDEVVGNSAIWYEKGVK
jgi:hypothetical protein